MLGENQSRGGHEIGRSISRSYRRMALVGDRLLQPSAASSSPVMSRGSGDATLSIGRFRPAQARSWSRVGRLEAAAGPFCPEGLGGSLAPGVWMAPEARACVSELFCRAFFSWAIWASDRAPKNEFFSIRNGQSG